MDNRDKGRFTQKGDEPRIQRGIKLTDSTWHEMEALATARGISRADLIEDLFQARTTLSADELSTAPTFETQLPTISKVDVVIAILDAATKLKANAGGAIKREIEKAIALLKS